jgi:NADPH:quinone reductase
VQAIVMEEFGPPEVLVLREVADPGCGPDEVPVEVSFSSVTFVETQVRWGRAPNPSMLPQFPAVPGNGVAGIVMAVGEEVGDQVVRRRVVSTTGGTGGYAGLVSVPADGVIPIPDDVALDDAAALLADGRTAVGLVDRVGDRTRSDRVGRGGGRRRIAVGATRQARRSVRRRRGRRERKLELARSLGADVAVDYREARWADRVAVAVNRAGVDVVFDGVGGSVGRDAFELLRPGGRLCSFGMASGSFTTVSDQELSDRGVTRVGGARPNPGELRGLTARALTSAAAGALRPVIGQRVPLAHAGDAHRAIEDRAALGQMLLAPS